MNKNIWYVNISGFPGQENFQEPSQISREIMSWKIEPREIQILPWMAHANFVDNWGSRSNALLGIGSLSVLNIKFCMSLETHRIQWTHAISNSLSNEPLHLWGEVPRPHPTSFPWVFVWADTSEVWTDTYEVGYGTLRLGVSTSLTAELHCLVPITVPWSHEDMAHHYISAVNLLVGSSEISLHLQSLAANVELGYVEKRIKPERTRAPTCDSDTSDLHIVFKLTVHHSHLLTMLNKRNW